jgi:hypothetical protein
LIARRTAGGDGGLEALRILKRRLSDVIYKPHAPISGPDLKPRLDGGAIDSPLNGARQLE